MKLLEQIGAHPIGETNVNDHEIEVVFGKKFLGFGDRGRGGDIITAISLLLLQTFSDDQVVFQDDDLFDGHRLCGYYLGSAAVRQVFLLKWPARLSRRAVLQAQISVQWQRP